MKYLIHILALAASLPAFGQSRQLWLEKADEHFAKRDYYDALDAGYYVRSADFYLLGGFIYRNQDAAVISLGAKMDGWIAKVAYDINVSSLSVSSAGRGGFEISFTYMKSNPTGPSSKICPRL